MLFIPRYSHRAQFIVLYPWVVVLLLQLQSSWLAGMDDRNMIREEHSDFKPGILSVGVLLY